MSLPGGINVQHIPHGSVYSAGFAAYITLGSMTKRPLYFRVTAIPPGEAPEWVRSKWIGLSLPLAQTSPKARVFPTVGVLSAPTDLLSCLFGWLTGKLVRESGYKIESCEAIRILALAHPEAGAWWKENTPYLLQPYRYFVFQQGTGYVDE